MFIYSRHGDKDLRLPIPEDFTAEDVQHLIKGMKAEKHLKVNGIPEGEPVQEVKEPVPAPVRTVPDSIQASKLEQGAIIKVGEAVKPVKVKEPAKPKVSGPVSKTCQVCGQVFSWEQKGRGRPATKCDGCRPSKTA